METFGSVFGLFGLIAFVMAASNTSRISRIQRMLRNENHDNRGTVKNMTEILSGYIGKDIDLDFYEDEECMDMLNKGKQKSFILVDVDDQWALVRIKLQKKEYDRLIRLSSIKGVSGK